MTHAFRFLPAADERGTVVGCQRRGTLQVQLRGAVEHTAQLPPMHKIAALADGHTREILERGVDQIELIAHAAHTGVGMETTYHRIAKRLGMKQTSQQTKDENEYQTVSHLI